jgi:hypothetical protein
MTPKRLFVLNAVIAGGYGIALLMARGPDPGDVVDCGVASTTIALKSRHGRLRHRPRAATGARSRMGASPESALLLCGNGLSDASEDARRRWGRGRAFRFEGARPQRR